MKISVIGPGYVGLVTGVCLAEMGHDVIMVGTDMKKAEAINRKEPPIYEEGLKEMLQTNNIRATTDYRQIAGSEVIFICVGTPSREDGSINLDHILSAAHSTAEFAGDAVVVMKSTVVPGTTTKLKEILGPRVAMNPEFLREGMAINDFMNPDKVVIGCEDDTVFSVLERLYSPFKSKIIRCNLETAEMIKYANNTFLATKVSLINEIANMCEAFGADIRKVAHAVGLDSRISPKFLRAGIGFGGSCFPKDLKALAAKAEEAGVEADILRAVLERNRKQPMRMVEMLEKRVEIKGSRISILGLAFKPGTDDIRESPSLKVIDELLKMGATVVAYDPMAMANAKSVYGDKVKFAASAGEALEGSDAALLVTEWDEFKKIKDHTHKMRGNIIIDGRLLLEPEEFKHMDFGGVGYG